MVIGRLAIINKHCYCLFNCESYIGHDPQPSLLRMITQRKTLLLLENELQCIIIAFEKMLEMHDESNWYVQPL